MPATCCATSRSPTATATTPAASTCTATPSTSQSRSTAPTAPANVYKVDAYTFEVTKSVTRAPNYEGFGQPALAADATRPLLRAGADVVFPAAGGAQFGALQTIVDTARSTGRSLFAIGADHDAYGNAEWQRSTDARDVILTSVVKRFDLAAYHVVRDHASGDLRAGSRTYDVANGGLTLAASAPAFDTVLDSLTPLQRDLRRGALVVPCVPAGVHGAAAVAAAAGPKRPAHG